MDKAQSYEEVFNNVVQTQILMEEKLGEAAGSMGVKPSYDMNVEDLYASYNNFRIDNGTAPEGSVRRNDLPSFNLVQMKRRLKAYHYDTYNQYYRPDGSNR